MYIHSLQKKSQLSVNMVKVSVKLVLCSLTEKKQRWFEIAECGVC